MTLADTRDLAYCSIRLKRLLGTAYGDMTDLARELEHDAVHGYYRPHETAARLVLTDIDYVTEQSVLGASATKRSAASLAAAFRSIGHGWDNLISAELALLGKRGLSRHNVWRSAL